MIDQYLEYTATLWFVINHKLILRLTLIFHKVM